MSGGAQTPGNSGEGWGKYYRAAAQYVPATGGREDGTPREPGARRKKLAGYLQAANELRQSYTAGYNSSRNVDNSGDDWAQMGVAQNSEGQLILFPSYARMRSLSMGQNADVSKEAPETYHEVWNLEDHSYNEYDAIIEVDVRGWLYYPQSGPLSRKNRYAMWVARQLCGLPAQASEQAGDNPTAQEAEEARQTASEIANATSRPSPPQSETGLDGAGGSGSRWSYWKSNPDGNQQQPQLSPDQIKEAHAAFTARIAPFTYRPMADVPLTVFFYNDTTSQSRSLMTSTNGHFSIRAQLPFIPTHVRVLASETLSATEEICLHSPDGISLISDIDDTVKHSAISLGMREALRNTFTAALPTLTIPGVGQWYKKLASSPYNVSMHYISNSPWQLYPLLKSFFQEAGLPPGSFHLKQYSGMFQGIFEPVADRKKGTVDRVITDFPHRKWILVGDSGEADLEVYTEIAERWPDKVLAVCIRDVTTTPQEAGYFDASTSFGSQNRDQQLPVPRQRTQDFDRPGTTPPTPPRGQRTAGGIRDIGGNVQPPPTPPRVTPPYTYASYTPSPAASTTSLPESTGSSVAPPRPSKPAALRSTTIPPKPPMPMRHTTSIVFDAGDYPPPPPSRTNTAPREVPPPPAPSRTSTATTLGQGTAAEVVNKREELWKRRWESAQERLFSTGVKLVSWRVGSDVEELTLALVEREMRREQSCRGRT